MQETFPSTVSWLVSTEYCSLTITDLIQGGRRVLGLSDAFFVLHRGHRGIELDVGRKRKVTFFLFYKLEDDK